MDTDSQQGRGCPTMPKRPASSDEEEEHADSDVLLLNVGGTLYTTTYGTVRSVQDSYLATLFAADGAYRAPATDADGRRFIDRDPEAFAVVLAYIRDGGASFSCAGLLWSRRSRRGYSAETSRGHDADIRRRRDAATPRPRRE